MEENEPKIKIHGDMYINGGAHTTYAFHYPKTLWRVIIPKSGEFQIHYTKELSPWVRFWMKFIGWDVRKGEKD